MSARDIFHNAVKTALQHDGWTITHATLSLEFGLGSLYVDLGAERVIALFSSLRDATRTRGYANETRS